MTDRFVVRAVVVGLFALGLAFGAGIIYLSATGHDHGVLDNLAAVVVGALAGVLAKTSTEVQPVAVVGQPVETVDAVQAAGIRKRRAARSDDGGVLLSVLIVVVVILLIGALIRGSF